MKKELLPATVLGDIRPLQNGFVGFTPKFKRSAWTLHQVLETVIERAHEPHFNWDLKEARQAASALLHAVEETTNFSTSVVEPLEAFVRKQRRLPKIAGWARFLTTLLKFKESLCENGQAPARTIDLRGVKLVPFREAAEHCPKSPHLVVNLDLSDHENIALLLSFLTSRAVNDYTNIVILRHDAWGIEEQKEDDNLGQAYFDTMLTSLSCFGTITVLTKVTRATVLKELRKKQQNSVT